MRRSQVDHGHYMYAHLSRAIDDGGALAMETARYWEICNTIRPQVSDQPQR